MYQPFYWRLSSYVSAPHYCKLLPKRFGQVGVWTQQQRRVGARRFQARLWHYKNCERTAYAVNMHLAMWRERRTSVGSAAI